jgi:predicted PurR-regulated permease PerM
VPSYRNSLLQALREIRERWPFLPPIDAFIAAATQELLAAAGERAAQPRTIARAVAGLAGALVSALFVLVVALYLLADRERIQRYALSFVPAQRRAHAETVLARASRRLGGWLVRQAVISAIVKDIQNDARPATMASGAPVLAALTRMRSSSATPRLQQACHAGEPA